MKHDPSLQVFNNMLLPVYRSHIMLYVLCETVKLWHCNGWVVAYRDAVDEHQSNLSDFSCPWQSDTVIVHWLVAIWSVAHVDLLRLAKIYK